MQKSNALEMTPEEIQSAYDKIMGGQSAKATFGAGGTMGHFERATLLKDTSIYYSVNSNTNKDSTR